MTAGTVTSADGTSISFDRLGAGPPVVIVSSALADRSDARRLAKHLSQQFTVVNYDRRGRGQSTDTAPYDVDREIEDIAAVLEAVGGRASLFGSSSGAVLALDAAGRLATKVDRLVLFEPPFIVDGSRAPLDDAYARRLAGLARSGQESEAVRSFMTEALGMPRAAVAMMFLLPTWRKLKRLAPTLPYDLAILDGTQGGKPLPADRWTAVTAPTLVVTGSKSDAFIHSGAAALSALLVNARNTTVEGANHSAVVAAPKKLAAAVARFLEDG
jgi:pimeloyl-ACP methyl ester carboxylesterase